MTLNNGRWPKPVRLVLTACKVLRTKGPRAVLGHVVQRLCRIRGSGCSDVSSKSVISYAQWLKTHEPSQTTLQAQRALSGRLPYRPLISVVTAVHNTPQQLLRDTIASVIAQTYDQWELCIVGGASVKAEVRDELARALERESRLHVKFLDSDQSVSANTSTAAELATGDFLCFLDQDGLLAPHALYEVARAVNQVVNADIVYFDNDKVSASGTKRDQPLCKPDWSPEMLLSVNYLSHCAIRRKLFTEVGGVDPSLDSDYEWDLVLRCTERTSSIVHIPQVLYSCRTQASSTAAHNIDIHPHLPESQRDAVKRHLIRIGIDNPSTEVAAPGVLRVGWPTCNSKVSIIIPTKDNLSVLKPCLTTLFSKTVYANFEVVLVDTGSVDPVTHACYKELVRDHGAQLRIVELIHQEFNYSAANNFGARHGTGDLLLFLNNDIEVIDEGWLEEMVRWAERPEIGIVGARLLYPDKTIQHAGIIVGMQGAASHVFMAMPEHTDGLFGSTDWYRNYSAVTGACQMMRYEVFEKLGGYDEAYTLLYSDVEVCLRAIEAGYRIMYTPFATLIHHESQSRDPKKFPPEDILRVYDHMKMRIETGDPYFNQNLSYMFTAPQLVAPDEQDRLERMHAWLSSLELMPAPPNTRE